MSTVQLKHSFIFRMFLLEFCTALPLDFLLFTAKQGWSGHGKFCFPFLSSGFKIYSASHNFICGQNTKIKIELPVLAHEGKTAQQGGVTVRDKHLFLPSAEQFILHFTKQLGKDCYSHFQLSRALNISIMHGQKNTCGVFSDWFLSVGGRKGRECGWSLLLLLEFPSAVGWHTCCKGNLGIATSCGCFLPFHRVSWRSVVKKAAGTLFAVLPWKKMQTNSPCFSVCIWCDFHVYIKTTAS